MFLLHPYIVTLPSSQIVRAIAPYNIEIFLDFIPAMITNDLKELPIIS